MDCDELKKMIETVLDNKFKEYWVDRESHYKQHEFIGKWMKWCDLASDTIWKSIIRWVVLGILSLILVGALLRFRLLGN